MNRVTTVRSEEFANRFSAATGCNHFLLKHCQPDRGASVNVSRTGVPLSMSARLGCLCQRRPDRGASVNVNLTGVPLSMSAGPGCLCQWQPDRGASVTVGRTGVPLSLIGSVLLYSTRPRAQSRTHMDMGARTAVGSLMGATPPV